MGTISLSIPQIGQPDTTEDVKVQNAFTAIQTVINGNLDRSNIAAGIARLLLTTKSANYAAVDGDLVEMTTASTVTLPTPTAGTTIGVFATTTPVTVTASSGSIASAGTLAASRTLGTLYVGVLLVADGSNWLTVSGQWDTGWVPLTLATNIAAVAGTYTPAARQRGDMVKLCGSVQNNNGITIGSNFATLPAGIAHPAQTIGSGVVVNSGSAVANFSVATNGLLFIQNFVNANIVNLDLLGEFRVV